MNEFLWNSAASTIRLPRIDNEKEKYVDKAAVVRKKKYNKHTLDRRCNYKTISRLPFVVRCGRFLCMSFIVTKANAKLCGPKLIAPFVVYNLCMSYFVHVLRIYAYVVSERIAVQHLFAPQRGKPCHTHGKKISFFSFSLFSMNKYS